MAIRTILLRKKISEKKSELDNLLKIRESFDAKRNDFAIREEEIVKAIEEATTDEERSAVEEATTTFDTEKSEFETNVSDTETKIADIEKEVNEMERELEAIETKQRSVPPLPVEPAKEEPKKTTKKSGGKRTMFKTRSIRSMSIVEREELVSREDTKAFLAEVRSAVAEKRAISGGSYVIPTTIAGLIREDIVEYSKLYKHVRVLALSGEGRVVVMGKSAEAFWEECCDPIYELEKAISKVDIDCFKVAGFVPLCNALIEDSDIDLLDEIMVSILIGIGYALDKAILYGTGVKMPTGIVTAIDDDDALKLTNEITISAENSVGVKLFQNLVRAIGKAANDFSRNGKTWAMSESTFTTVQAESLAVNAAGAIVAGVSETMPVAGGDIEILNFVPANNIVAGYFDLYVLGERKGMTVDTSEHVRFLQDQTVVRGRARYDGKPAVVGAFVVIGINGTTPSTSVEFANPSED